MSMTGKFWRGVSWDLSGILLALGAAFAMGFCVNLVRKNPLPLIYENRETRTLKVLSPATMSEIREPEAIEFRLALQAWKDGSALFVDARETAFYDEGHIPGAVSLPREEVGRAATVPDLADKLRPLVVYCAGEDCDDSLIVAKGLLMAGYARVSLYTGGWNEWIASGSPVGR